MANLTKRTIQDVKREIRATEKLYDRAYDAMNEAEALLRVLRYELARMQCDEANAKKKAKKKCTTR